MGWDGIGTLLGKISTFIPGRIEKIKNEKERLISERSSLLSKEFSVANAKRIVSIDGRVQQINSILGNNAKD